MSGGRVGRLITVFGITLARPMRQSEQETVARVQMHWLEAAGSRRSSHVRRVRPVQTLQVQKPPASRDGQFEPVLHEGSRFPSKHTGLTAASPHSRVEPEMSVGSSFLSGRCPRCEPISGLGTRRR
jgi:hypothetical protein